MRMQFAAEESKLTIGILRMLPKIGCNRFLPRYVATSDRTICVPVLGFDTDNLNAMLARCLEHLHIVGAGTRRILFLHLIQPRYHIPAFIPGLAVSIKCLKHIPVVDGAAEH